MENNGDTVMDEDNLLCKLYRDKAGVALPNTLQPKILKWVHGSKANGQF